MMAQQDRMATQGLDDPAEGSAQDTLETWLAALQAIDEALGRSRNVVRIPSRMVLERLPPELRGSRWGVGLVPETVVELDPWELIAKIRSGRVVYPLRRLRQDLPAGWVAGDGDGDVELDAGTVRKALPPHLAANVE